MKRPLSPYCASTLRLRERDCDQATEEVDATGIVAMYANDPICTSRAYYCRTISTESGQARGHELDRLRESFSNDSNG